MMSRVLFILCFLTSVFTKAETVRIGSKIFTESYILAEVLAQTIESRTDMDVQKKYGLGGTGIIFEALKNNEIDLYIEYTGTLTEAILKKPDLQSSAALKELMLKQDIVMSDSLGFNNTYAIAVKRDFAEKHALKTMSDLKKVEDSAVLAMSYEFMNRADGYGAMVNAYGYKFKNYPKSMDHSLAYQAIQSGQADVAEVYSTDAKIEKLDLVVLEDDRQFFPKYEPIILARRQFVEKHPDVWQALLALEGKLSNEEMRELNAYGDIDKKSFADIAHYYLNKEFPEASSSFLNEQLIAQLGEKTKEHLILVIIAVCLSTFFGIPLGILSTRKKWLERLVLSVSGVIQTIPSLALLCFLIPFLGIGTKPAIVALFLYGLLPVVVNTFTGIESIESKYTETAEALGLSPWQILLKVELPLASQSIWAGVTTSTIISIGTATLAALIGAGGYGAAIITGLALNDITTILYGAIPAALLALIAQAVLKFLGQLIIPKGLL